jgi:hypothetical protein
MYKALAQLKIQDSPLKRWLLESTSEDPWNPVKASGEPLDIYNFKHKNNLRKTDEASNQTEVSQSPLSEILDKKPQNCENNNLRTLAKAVFKALS